MITQEILDILFMYLKAFAVGGAICTVAQLVINFTDLTSGKILVFTMLAGVVLTALGVYQPLVDFAGAGATVPDIGVRLPACKRRDKGRGKGLLLCRYGFAHGGKRGGDGSRSVLAYYVAHLSFQTQAQLN